MAKHTGPRKNKNWKGEYYWLKNQWLFFTKPKLKLKLIKMIGVSKWK